MREMVVIVPSRGRPQNAVRMMNAWVSTGAYEVARLVLALDQDDPEYRRYPTAIEGVSLVTMPDWMPMVHKLDATARFLMEDSDPRFFAFMGDDHVPRTVGWAQRYCEELDALGTGIVYGNDLIQGKRLCTQWAMTADIVRALDRMVPAPVEHMYCDNSIMDLGNALGRLKYLPDVTIEHAHPVAGRGSWDAGYERVNSRAQYRKDHGIYQQWRYSGMAADVAAVRALITEGTPA